MIEKATISRQDLAAYLSVLFLIIQGLAPNPLSQILLLGCFAWILYELLLVLVESRLGYSMSKIQKGAVVTIVVIALGLSWPFIKYSFGVSKISVDVDGCSKKIQSTQRNVGRLCLTNDSEETVTDVEAIITSIEPAPPEWPFKHVRLHFMEDGPNQPYSVVTKTIKPHSFKPVDVVEFDAGYPDSLRIWHIDNALSQYMKRRNYCITIEISADNNKSFLQHVLIGVDDSDQLFIHAAAKCNSLGGPMIPTAMTPTSPL